MIDLIFYSSDKHLNFFYQNIFCMCKNGWKLVQRKVPGEERGGGGGGGEGGGRVGGE